MFKDTFETNHKPQPRPLTSAEQSFWRIVSMSPELQQLAQALKSRGQFTGVQSGSSAYVRYAFPWNGQTRQFDAQITQNTNIAQLKNFLTTCQKGVNGIFEQPNITPYMPVSRRPF